MLHTINSEAELKDNKLKGFNRKAADNECNYLKTINKHITARPPIKITYQSYLL